MLTDTSYTLVYLFAEDSQRQKRKACGDKHDYQLPHWTYHKHSVAAQHHQITLMRIITVSLLNLSFSSWCCVMVNDRVSSKASVRFNLFNVGVDAYV